MVTLSAGVKVFFDKRNCHYFWKPKKSSNSQFKNLFLALDYFKRAQRLEILVTLCSTFWLCVFFYLPRCSHSCVLILPQHVFCFAAKLRYTSWFLAIQSFFKYSTESTDQTRNKQTILDAFIFKVSSELKRLVSKLFIWKTSKRNAKSCSEFYVLVKKCWNFNSAWKNDT